MTRLGLVEPSTNCLLSVACSFAGHHAVKRQYASCTAHQDGAPPLWSRAPGAAPGGPDIFSKKWRSPRGGGAIPRLLAPSSLACCRLCTELSLMHMLLLLLSAACPVGLSLALLWRSETCGAPSPHVHIYIYIYINNYVARVISRTLSTLGLEMHVVLCLRATATCKNTCVQHL